ncbi:MAG TPA: hypothetical protein VGP77_17310 [Vicinamibacterales bacterium]|nr:hypothetical protein [Vicinamibacterales bacterium]
MALAGTAALAMWWDIAPEVRSDFEHWHAHEHFPERLAIPGFLRASRWRSSDGGDGTFVLYELADREVLRSPSYLARLNAPTPWSTRLMPHHRNMVRSQCRVLESRGGVTARSAVTVRLAPAAGREASLRLGLRDLFESAPTRPGLVGLHLLRHEPPSLAATTEQHLRGLADAEADWVLIASGDDPDAVAALGAGELGEEALMAMGAAPGFVCRRFDLAYAAMSTDVAGIAASATAAA